MHGLEIILAVTAIIVSPAALIVSVISLNKTRMLSEFVKFAMQKKTLTAENEPQQAVKQQAAPVVRPQEAMADIPLKQTIVNTANTAAAAAKDAKIIKPTPQSVLSVEHHATPKPVSQPLPNENLLIEQQIGTKWVLIAGVFSVIFGVGFFMKYAYDNALIGPLGRVIIAVIGGIAALLAGEITRRRGYGIVAKGVTALGFVILYTAVFSAHRFYGLIGAAPAFSLSILITASAMVYAVGMDEVLIAILSLVGGFLAPVIVFVGRDMPVPLFCYVLILGSGAMICAYYRKWQPINAISFAATILFYGSWLLGEFLPAAQSRAIPAPQMLIAIGWLVIFFMLYLTMPLLNGLINKKAAQNFDVALTITNAVLAFIGFWLILFDRYRIAMALCSLGLSAVYFGVLRVVMKRCRNDYNLRAVLVMMGLFFITIAIALYFKMYALSISWALEAVIITLVGFRYRSALFQYSGFVVLFLSFGQMLALMPMHTAAFTVVLNPVFGSWMFVVASIVGCHIIYRRNLAANPEDYSVVSQGLYCAAAVLLMCVLAGEWWYHCDYNIGNSNLARQLFIVGTILIFGVFIPLCLMHPVCPQGKMCRNLAVLIAFTGSIFTLAALPGAYYKPFIIFANLNFITAAVFVLVLFAASVIIKRNRLCPQDGIAADMFAFGAIVVLWFLMTEQICNYWFWRHKADSVLHNWSFLAGMYVSVMWAVYAAVLLIAGFRWNKAALRYISLSIFVILLFKVFIFDMSTVRSVYRITAFLVTGLVLVGVSYLYQYLKKHGFFEKTATGDAPQKRSEASE